MNHDTMHIPLPCAAHEPTSEPVRFSAVSGTTTDETGKEWQAIAATRVCRKCGWKYQTQESCGIRCGVATLL